jgi:site-specific recombinase XerD
MDISEFLNGQNSKETIRAYKSDLDQFRKITGGDLTRSGVIRFRDHLMKSGASPSSIARKMSSVRSFCDFLRGQGKLNLDPFVGIRAPKVSVMEPTQAFTDEEVRRMFTIADSQPNPRERERDLIVLGLLFYAGLRRSEVVGLLFSDILEMDGGLVIRVRGKGGKVRLIPAHPKLREFLLPHLTASHFWKTDNTAPLLGISANTVYNIVKKYAKLAGVTRPVSPHSCRATAISQLLEKGESPRNVADFAGHSSVNTTIGSYDKKRDGLKNSPAMKLNF